MTISKSTLRRAVLESSIVLVIGLIAGLLFSYVSPEVSGGTFDVLRDTLAPLMKLSGLELFGLILLNNVVKAYIAMAVGIGLGIYSAFFLLVNGFVLGSVMEIVGSEAGLAFVFASIIPHGIFEIPAILLAAGLGLILGRCGLARMRGRECELKPIWKESNRIFFVYILPALVIASAVEVFITPLIAGLV